MSENTRKINSRKIEKAASKPGKRRGGLVALMYIAFVLGISMVLASIIILSANEVFAFVKPDIAGVIEVPENATTREIAASLQSAGIINNTWLFEIYTWMSKADGKFQSGKYELNANMDYPQIVRILKRTSSYRETITLTIPEGYTLSQIVTLLSGNKVAKEEDLRKALFSGEFNYDFVKELPEGDTRLEGYLFPDTYEFYIDDSAENVIDKMLKNFDNRFSADLRSQAKANGVSIRDAVIIASLIEKEAKLNRDRPAISSVIYNRLKSEDIQLLQIDATLVYILGHVPTAADKTIDSPYNTYRYGGLPPGPICSPGLSSIKAAVRPDYSNYFYYVAKPDGGHIFSITYDEHLAAIEEVAKMKEEQPEESESNEG